MPFIIGTAGHIDHGKTALVKALTGQDTDRLKEEKERGISIDLGFAHFDLPDGTRAGVVDVPGHERFIRNMLAGAHGIDLVLFIVAADDGVMPQTEEHLDIVHLLGVRRGIVVLTKVDLVAEQRRREVEDEIRVLTAGTALEGAPVIAVSAVTGEGVEDLRMAIVRSLRDQPPRPAAGRFRLPVDRVFLMPGHGVVVTGTALAGTVRVGDRVRCLPGGQLLRVRSIQVHNDAVDAAESGQRVALNLSTIEKITIERGDVICQEDITMISDRLDAHVETVRLKADTTYLKNHQRVRVHIGTAERLGKLVLLGSQQLRSKESGYCQIALTEPVLALRGDRFIIRDETAQRTLGGGQVINPWAQTHRRNESRLLEKLALLHAPDRAAALAVFLSDSDGLATPIGPLSQFADLPDAETHALLQRAGGIQMLELDEAHVYTTVAKWDEVKERLLNALREFHAGHPLAPGMEMEQVRDLLPGAIAPRVFRAVVDRLAGEQALVRDGGALRLPTHSVKLKSDEQLLADRIAAMLGKTPLTPPDVKQLEADTRVARAKLTEVLRVMEREKTVVRASPELYFLRDAVDRVKATLKQRMPPRGEVAPGTFRDLFDTSRKYAIPLLELLDREGVTVRIGDTRRMR